MRLRDAGADYGWISIGLHWVGATVVLAMLFVGDSIRGEGGVPQIATLKTHTTIGLGFYLLLWARAYWRIRLGHPEPLPRQKSGYYALGKAFHHVLIGAIALMLLSGPVLAWAGGLPLRLFDLELPSPFPASPWLFQATRMLHGFGAAILAWGSLLHILAVIKHTVFDRDGSLDRILAPPIRPADRP